jgi:P-loop Domain of unknown function (DUF2791)
VERVIHHRKWGTGRILKERHGGYSYLVQFQGGPKRWVLADELLPAIEEPHGALVPPQQTGPQVSATPKPRPTHGPQFRARRLVEALRMGIVPEDAIEDFTFGRDEELETVSAWLHRGRKGSCLVVGDYGAGKTHLLNVIRSRALREGYAVCLTALDPQESPLHKPKRVYRDLAASLAWREESSTSGFRDLIRGGIVSGALRDHEFFRWMNQGGEPEWEWVSAKGQLRPTTPGWYSYDGRYPGMYDNAPSANLYTYLLTGLAWAAKSVGLRGLLLILDEAESIATPSYSYQSLGAYNFLRALLRSANDDPAMAGPPQTTGLTFGGNGPRLPFSYRQPAGLKVIIGLTSLDWNREYSWTGEGFEAQPKVAEVDHARQLRLHALTEHAFEPAIGAIRDNYDLAYGTVATDPRMDSVLEDLVSQAEVTRLFMKGAVELFDLQRFGLLDELPAERS